MTSSKSIRAAFSPSFSLSSILSNSDTKSDSKSKSNQPPRNTLRKKPSLDLGQQQQSLPRSQSDQLPRAVSPSKASVTERVPRSLLSRKSKTWSNRVSTYLPTLITPNTDQQTPTLIERKPTVSTNASPEYAPPPPPPYVPVEPNELPASQIGLAVGPEDVPAQQTESSPSDPNYVAGPVPSVVLDMPQFSISDEDIPATVAAPLPSDTHSDASNDGTSKPKTLQKENKKVRPRSSSVQQSLPNDLTAAEPTPRRLSPSSDARGRRSFSAQVIPPSGEKPILSTARTLPVSRDGSGRSQSPSRGRIRRSWFPGSNRSRSNSIEVTAGGKLQAWIISEETQAEYNPSLLQNGEKVPELWNENGAVVVYLYPRGSGCGPSFKVPEFTVSSSYIFEQLMQSEQDSPGSVQSRAKSFGGRDSLSANDAVLSPPMSPPGSEYPGDRRLYLPTAPPTATGQLSTPGEGSHAELDRLVAIRNLFAFLNGQPLVGTKSRPTMFSAFLQIAGLLQEFGFSSDDGTTFGNAVDLSFGFYSEQHAFADCRHSREKTLEALILGERMRSAELYNEAFAHAAGKYAAILDLRLPLFEQVSLLTRQRLERAHLDLVNRQHNVNEHLEQFEFPSMFAGVASSTSIPELKQIRFKTWRNSFNRMRQFVLGYYRTTFGNWPPRASSKKNPFAESGLNRLVLKMLYSDLCALYDLLVDRTNRTSRVMDEIFQISRDADKATTSALRSILSEYDRSKPPVLPPVPYDLPQLPSMTSILENFKSLSIKEQAKYEKKVKENELILILNKAYNFDTSTIQLPFLDQFKEFEIREGKGKPAPELADHRIGYWLFLYVVIQSLPMLVVDAPGLKFTEGTEYFLCQPTIGNLPWIEDRQVRKLWYEVAGGGGLVELSADTIEFSVEGTYHRSHCWLAGKQWDGVEGVFVPPVEDASIPPLHPPRAAFQGGAGSLPGSPSISGPGTPSPPPGGPGPAQGAIRPRNLSPNLGAARSNTWRTSIAMGLEPVPLEPPTAFGVHQRSSSMGPLPPSGQFGGRSVSSGNLSAMSRDSMARPMTPSTLTSGTTFDDILGESKKPAVAKKRSRFF